MAGIIRKIKVGEKEITFESNGATFLAYQHQFKKDGLKAFQELNFEEDSSSALLLMEEFAYIMSGAYKDGTAFIDWLAQFGLYDLPMAMEQIMELLNDNITPIVDDGNNDTKKAEATEE